MCRHERGETMPPLEAALAYEVIFRTPVSVLFATTYANTAQLLEAKLADLKTDLEQSSGKAPGARVTAHKIEWLTMRNNP